MCGGIFVQKEAMADGVGYKNRNLDTQRAFRLYTDHQTECVECYRLKKARELSNY